jgi:hypothetical protein
MPPLVRRIDPAKPRVQRQFDKPSSPLLFPGGAVNKIRNE